MKQIAKQREPRSLSQHRRWPEANYASLPQNAKNDLRRSLIKEQGHLCCYCMSRVTEGASRIEHFSPQHFFPDQDLIYENILLACSGNEHNSPQHQHCDVRKGDEELCFNPSEIHFDLLARIKYLGTGQIESGNAEFNRQINEVLNLNYSRLIQNRKEVIKGIFQVLEKMGQVSRQGLRKLVKKWNDFDKDGKKKPYFGVALYQLEKRMKRV